MQKTFLFGILLIFSIGLISAVQVCDVYDDFSSGSLNTSKWEESTFQGDPFPDEHFVNSTLEIYHVAQIVEGPGQVNLQPKRQFSSGDSFSYDAIYKGGSGNHFSQPLINGNYPPTQVEACTAPGGCGPIGFFNGVPDLEAQNGTYNITFEFFASQVKMTAIRPDNVTIVNTFTGNSEPYNLTVNTHTGHNGLMHFDYDNFIVCSEEEEPPEPPAPSLEERVELLEQKVADLENRTTILETMVQKIKDFISHLPKGLGKRFV